MPRTTARTQKKRRVAKTPIRNLRVDDERWARYVAVAEERGFPSTTAWVLDALDLVAGGEETESQQLALSPTMAKVVPDRPARSLARTFKPDFKKTR